MKDKDKNEWLSELSEAITGNKLTKETATKEDLIHIIDHLDNIIASLPGSFYWKDIKGVYQAGNNYLAKIAGFESRIEIPGKTDKDFARIFNWNNKELARILDTDKAVIETGRPAVNHEEHPFNIIGGSNLIQLTNKVPLYDKNKKIVGVLGISIDFTERKKLEENLENENAKAVRKIASSQGNIERIIACMPGSVYWKDTQGVYLGCNDAMAKMMGLPKSEIIGKTDLDFAEIFGAIEIAEAFRRADLAVISSGVPNLNVEEPPFHFADGKTIYQLSNRVPLLDENNNIVGIIGSSIDITERKKTEKELIQAQKNAEAAAYIMTEFISNMGHDLATPISDVGSVADVLNNYSSEYPELQELFEILVQRSADCEKVRERIINATSISNLEVNYETFSIVQTLVELEKELRPSIGSKHLKIIIHPFRPKKEDLIETDREKFYAILSELITNAINFTEIGQVTISVLKQNNNFHIQVSDTGIGIPADKYEYIFEQYTKLSRSNKHGANFRGVGAGLYLTRIRASILNATINVKSEVNKGSTFTCSIPAHPVREQ